VQKKCSRQNEDKTNSNFRSGSGYVSKPNKLGSTRIEQQLRQDFVLFRLFSKLQCL